MTDVPVEAVALSDSERIDRLERAVSQGSGIDLGEFDTPEHQAANKAAADQAAADEIAAQQAAAEAAAAAPAVEVPAEVPAEPAVAEAGVGSSVGSIADYDSQTIDEIASQIGELDQADLDAVSAYEVANANRVDVLDAVVKRQAAIDALAD